MPSLTKTSLAVLLLLTSSALALVKKDNDGVYTREYFDHIRSQAKTWTVADYDQSMFKTDQSILERTGLILPSETRNLVYQGLFKTFQYLTGISSEARQSSQAIYRDHERAAKLGIPTSFDARD